MIENLISAAVPETSWLVMNILPCTISTGVCFSVRKSGDTAWADWELRKERISSPGGGTEGMEVR